MHGPINVKYSRRILGVLLHCALCHIVLLLLLLLLLLFKCTARDFFFAT